MKYKIEKNTVQETLILPLYSRKLCTELYPNLYRDETAVRLLDQINYNFSGAEKNSRSLMQRFGALEVAMRQNDLAFEVRAYLKTHPCAAVVNLGCGLDNTGRACDNGSCKIYNLDFPDVIALRQQLLPAGEREQNIPCDLNDTAWFDKIDASGGAVFFASGVFYYFPTQQVRELVRGMADAFPGGVLVFDAANRTAPPYGDSRGVTCGFPSGPCSGSAGCSHGSPSAESGRHRACSGCRGCSSGHLLSPA